MLNLHLNCLGAFSATTANGQAVQLRTEKVRALLIYLALEPRPHRREALAGLLWPNIGDDYALKNLRNSLHRLRQPFEEASPGTGEALFVIDRHTLALNPEAFSTDIQLFEQLIQNYEAHSHDKLAECDDCLGRLAQSAALYRDDLLAGFSLADAPAFEEWLTVRREAVRQKLLIALRDLAIAHEARNEWDAAQRYARQLLTLEPWREEAHRLLMRILAHSGQSNSALAQYQVCRQVLAAELGIEPDAETTALYEQIRAGNLRLQPVVSRQSSIVNTHDWGEMPAVDVFHGRSAEMVQLESWLVQEHCRLVSVLGIGGVGKTTLAAATTKAVAPAFDGVIWRSLLNAPPLDDVLRNWLQVLSGQTLSSLPESLDERLRLLLNYLRQHHCLLVLDNVESILQPSGPEKGRAGEVRPGYEGYAQLFERLASSDHRSCVLLTSREQPYALSRIGRETPMVRSLRLSGLDLQAGQAILQGSGLRASAQEAALLIKNYSGNPLALQIVGNTIADFFGGNVAAFQQDEGFIFDGIRAVLDQQFARLSDLERDILVWLAIEREAITVQTLRGNLVQAVTTPELLSALNALQARSLLEKAGDGLTLQNVVIEYLTERLIEGVCAEIAAEATVWMWFNHFALLKAQAKEYVRQSQARLILQPVAERLLAQLGKEGLLAKLQAQHPKLSAAPGYAAGNLLNLLLQLNMDVTGYDFSKRTVWQAFLRERTIHSVNFSQADLSGTVFTQPFGFIYSVAYSPDGSLIAGGSQDGTVFLWRADNGQSEGAYQGHTATVYGVAFSPDGKLLASASEDTTICIRDWQSGQLRHVLREHTGFVNSVAFSPDGRLLASGSDDCRVHVWDVATGSLIHNWFGNENRTIQVAFGGPPGADGAWLACCGDDGKVRVRETATGQLIQELDGPGHVVSLAFSKHPEISQATLVATGTEGVVRLWDVDSQGGWSSHDMPKGEEDFNTTLAFSPDGTLIASAGGGQAVRLRDARTGAVVASLPGHSHVYMLAFSPDGQFLTSTSRDRTVRVWNLRTQQVQHILSGYSAWVSALVFDARSDLWVSTIDGAQIRIWHAQTGNTRHTLLGHNKPISKVAFSPSGRLLLSGGMEGSVHIWDVQSGGLRDSLTGHTGQIQALASNQVDTLFATSAYDNAVGLWSAHGSAPAQRLGMLEHHDKAIYALAFGGPAGATDTLLAGSGYLNIYVWDIATQQVRYTLSAHTIYCESLTFSRDGALLASGGSDHQVCVWEMATGQLRHALRSHHGSIWGLTFSPDGRFLVSVSGDQQICVWDIEHGVLIRTLHEHTAWLTAITFNQDGTLMASGSADGAVKLWDVTSMLATNACLATLYAKGPYAGMNITDVTGVSEAQKQALKALGAYEES